MWFHVNKWHISLVIGKNSRWVYSQFTVDSSDKFHRSLFLLPSFPHFVCFLVNFSITITLFLFLWLETGITSSILKSQCPTVNQVVEKALIHSVPLGSRFPHLQGKPWLKQSLRRCWLYKFHRATLSQNLRGILLRTYPEAGRYSVGCRMRGWHSSPH